jgi:hypothetical protein
MVPCPREGRGALHRNRVCIASADGSFGAESTALENGAQ